LARANKKRNTDAPTKDGRIERKTPKPTTNWSRHLVKKKKDNPTKIGGGGGGTVGKIKGRRRVGKLCKFPHELERGYGKEGGWLEDTRGGVFRKKGILTKKKGRVLKSYKCGKRGLTDQMKYRGLRIRGGGNQDNIYGKCRRDLKKKKERAINKGKSPG